MWGLTNSILVVGFMAIWLTMIAQHQPVQPTQQTVLEPALQIILVVPPPPPHRKPVKKKLPCMITSRCAWTAVVKRSAKHV